MNTKTLIEKAEQGDALSQLKLGQSLLAEGFPSNISNACVYWLEKAADRMVDRVALVAMKELVRVYLLYAGADALYVMDALYRFSNRKNPVAMLELGRIFYGDKDSAYLKKFNKDLLPGNRNVRHDKDYGFALIDEAAGIAEKLGNENPFDSTHFYIFAEIYVARAKDEKHYRGTKDKNFLSLLDKQLFYAKKACTWVKVNYASSAHEEDCKALYAYARKLRAEFM